MAKDKATDLAENQKHLARDVMDKYEEKLVDLTQKYDLLKSETKKHKEDAKRYREQREQCKLIRPRIAQSFWLSFLKKF